LAWISGTIPTILVAIFFPLSVLRYVQTGAGLLSIALGIMIIPAYYNLTKNTDKNLLLGNLGKSKLLIAFASIAMIVMAISSFITIG
jgi:hypothetical protein